ncbi:MAG: radical SAM protein [uncultured bacterium (gcode 4)]|uniref:Radical SAM protein n=1 Tax=uncultured bacterium (gcode 4) TaxID=1234023 RepID=K2FGI6_9BACT|nr:MAG: radical SAM protein [uncultured bacterium (gcode 4)]
MEDNKLKNWIKLIRSSSMKCLLNRGIKNDHFNPPTDEPWILYERNENEWMIYAMDDFSIVKIPKSENMKYNDAIRFKSPIIVRWDITYKCNYKCLHCYSECSPEHEHWLPTEKVKELLDLFDEQKVQFVQILWWEPMMRKDIFEIISYAATKKFIFCINSNWFLLNANNIRKLSEIGLKFIQISLHWLEKEHNFLANNDSFDRVSQNIRLLVESWINVSVSWVISDINSKTTIDYLDYLVSIWVKNIQLLTPLDEWRSKKSSVSLDEKDFKILKERLLAYKNENTHINIDLPWFDIDLIDWLAVRYENDKNFEFLFWCIWWVSGIRVDPLWRACICVWRVWNPIWSLFEEPIEDIMRKMHNWRIENVPTMCRWCEHYLQDCQGACYLRF